MKFEKITAFYGSKRTLTNVSFALPPQKCTLLVGKNGCGKSTLLRCLAGQLPCRGSIPLPRDPRERAKKVAYLPQFLPAVPMEAEALVAMGRTPYLNAAGVQTPADTEKIEQAITLTDIEGLRHRRVDTLSGGERQRVYLAMVLAQDTELILLDEPTTHMDMGAAAEFMALLHRLTERGKTVFAVLHDLNLAVNHADQLLLMEEGQLTDPARIEEVFGVKKYSGTDGEKTVFFYR